MAPAPPTPATREARLACSRAYRDGLRVGFKMRLDPPPPPGVTEAGVTEGGGGGAPRFVPTGPTPTPTWVLLLAAPELARAGPPNATVCPGRLEFTVPSHDLEARVPLVARASRCFLADRSIWDTTRTNQATPNTVHMMTMMTARAEYVVED